MRKGYQITIEFIKFTDGIYPELTSYPLLIQKDDVRFLEFLKDMIQMWNLKLEFERSLEKEEQYETQKQNTEKKRQ